MKKLFVAFFAFMLFSPAIFAQLNPVQGPLPGPDLLLEYLKKYSKVLEPSMEKDMVKFSSETVEAEYTTEEQTAIDNAILRTIEYGRVILPEEEKQKTDSYREVTVTVPNGYTINKYIAPEETKEKLVFLVDRSILVYINAREATFKLDYDITFENEEEVLGEEGYFYNALTFKIKYAPKYFTFRKISDKYNPAKTVQVEYKGQIIDLNTEVYPVLTITTPHGYDMQYVLEPNYQNIYNDFEFVRKGHKEATIKEIKNK